MDITFNGLNLNDATNYWVEELVHEATAKQEINIQKIARSNRSILLRKNFGVKTITASVIVEDSSVALLDARLDTLKRYCEASESNLDIDFSTGTRRYVCTGFIMSIDRKPRWARVALTFECYRAFGEDTSNTTESFTGKTTSPYADDIEFSGSAPAQPEITITINSLTGSGSKYVQVKNVDTGEYVKILKTDWQADDVITINCENAIATINGNAVQYLGIMPEWIYGTNNWEYSDDLDARNVDIEFSYKKKWL